MKTRFSEEDKIMMVLMGNCHSEGSGLFNIWQK